MRGTPKRNWWRNAIADCYGLTKRQKSLLTVELVACLAKCKDQECCRLLLGVSR